MNFEVNLHINAEQLKKYYTGTKIVSTHCTDNRRVEFPVSILQKYISHDGIHGRFNLEYDNDFKFKSIKKLI